MSRGILKHTDTRKHLVSTSPQGGYAEWEYYYECSVCRDHFWSTNGRLGGHLCESRNCLETEGVEEVLKRIFYGLSVRETDRLVDALRCIARGG